MELWQSISDIVTAPFVGDLDLVHLFLLIGIILVFIAAWVLILNKVRDAAMEA